MRHAFVDTKPLVGQKKHPMDRMLFLMTLVLMGVGVVTVFDASYALALEHRHGNPYYFVVLQATWAFLGLIAMFGARIIPYKLWKQIALHGIAVTAVLLVCVFIPHVGIWAGGARRWVGHGIFRVQPSEIAKVTLVMYLARYAAANPSRLRRFKEGLLPPLLFLTVIVVLIAKEPDLGTAMVVGGSGLTLLFLAGARRKHILSIIGVSIVLIIIYTVAQPYRQNRIKAWLHPAAGKLGNSYQVFHSEVAIGTGGPMGVGLGEGKEKLYIPMARTDFIFPVIAEEWGLIGTLGLIAAFFIVCIRGFTIAYQTKDPFGSFLAAGITTVITLQALVNVGVATGTIPDTGVPLPFISYGGSSMIFSMIGIGILLNISCNPGEALRPEIGPKTPMARSERDFGRRPSAKSRRRDLGYHGRSDKRQSDIANTFTPDWTSRDE